MKTDNGYKVVLRAYGDKEGYGKTVLTSTVDITCKHYSTFTAIVDAVMPILEKEESDPRDENMNNTTLSVEEFAKYTSG